MYKYNNNRNNDIGTWNRNEPTICGVTRSDSKTTDRNTALAKTNETTDSVEIKQRYFDDILMWVVKEVISLINHSSRNKLVENWRIFTDKNSQLKIRVVTH